MLTIYLDREVRKSHHGPTLAPIIMTCRELNSNPSALEKQASGLRVGLGTG